MPTRMTRSILAQAVLVLSTFASLSAARHIPAGLNITAIDPFKDPADDPFNPLGYIANNGLTAMAVGEYAVLHFYDPETLRLPRPS